MSQLVVTTSARPQPRQQRRAEQVAERCGVPVVARRSSLPQLLERAAADLAYVVERDRECLSDGTRTLFVNEGLLHARLAPGAAHPLVRALGPVTRVVDGTLGLAQDALHIAAATGAQVLGVEASAALASLCEVGLDRLHTAGLSAAGQVTVHHGDSRALLTELGPADVVFLSPMFDEPQGAAPGWDLLRHLAQGSPLDRAWLDAALRAAPAVVVKVRRTMPLPPFVADLQVTVLRGKSVDYWRIVRPAAGPT